MGVTKYATRIVLCLNTFTLLFLLIYYTQLSTAPESQLKTRTRSASKTYLISDSPNLQDLRENMRSNRIATSTKFTHNNNKNVLSENFDYSNDALTIAKFKYRQTCSPLHATKIPEISLFQNGRVTETLLYMARNPKASLRGACPVIDEKKASFPVPVTCLLSFPGSGNSWMRHLLHQMTDIATGSVYMNNTRKTGIFDYEGHTEDVIVVKSHTPSERNGSLRKVRKDGSIVYVNFDRVVFILRNPYAALIAEYKRSTMNLGKIGNGFIDINSDSWKMFFTKRGKNWGIFVKKALNTTLPIHVIVYEDLVSDLLTEMVKLAIFMRTDYLDEFSFCCTVKESEGRFHRPPSNQTIEDVYPPENRKILNAVVEEAAYSIGSAFPDVANTILNYIWT